MRCAIYIRVSTSKEEQKSSLENQREIFMKLIAERNYTLAGIYEDIASGTSTKHRPSFLNLIDDIKAGKIDLVLTKEISRLGRSTIDVGKFYELCKETGVHLIALNNGVDTLTHNTQYISLYTAFAEMESENTSLRIKTGLDSIARSGRFKGSIPPFGYFVENGVLKVRNDFTPNIVKRIFKKYISGDGLDTIARHLSRDKIPTPAQIAKKQNAGVFWSGRTIQLILNNRHYIGDLVQCKTEIASIRTKKRIKKDPKDYIVVENTHEAIISKEDFQLAQDLLAIRSRKQNNHRRSTHLFSNLLFCGDCGKGMHYKANRKGYVCGSYDKNGKFACTSHIIREKDLESIILNDISVILKNVKYNHSSAINSKLNKEKTALEQIISQYKNKIEKLNSTKSNALLKLCDEIITDSDYKQVVTAVDTKIDYFTSQIKEINQKLNKIANLTQDDFLKLTNQLSCINKLTNELLTRLIKRIEVKENGDVKIFYRFSYLQFTDN